MPIPILAAPTAIHFHANGPGKGKDGTGTLPLTPTHMGDLEKNPGFCLPEACSWEQVGSEPVYGRSLFFPISATLAIK